jgi:uncharacterized protein (TIGR00730 family)
MEMNPAAHERIELLKTSPTFALAFEDDEFLHRSELRPNRMELELMKATLVQDEQNIHSTIVLFGSARIPEPAEAARRLEAARAAAAEAPEDMEARRALAATERIAAKSHFYEIAQEFARIVSTAGQCDERLHYVICTGGGPGIMEAGNRGAFDAEAKSIGLNITLPREQEPNPFISPELCFRFRYFAMRKIHFLMRAKALVVFPGGFGTLDELFETLTLVQTGKVKPLPIVLCGREFWRRALDFEFLVEEGVIDRKDADLISFAETAVEIWRRISDFYGLAKLFAEPQRQFP